MSTRETRYLAAVMLAHEILDGPPEDDLRRVAEAIATLSGEVAAGRKNQAEFPEVAAELFARMCEPPPRLYSVRVDGEADDEDTPADRAEDLSRLDGHAFWHGDEEAS